MSPVSANARGDHIDVYRTFAGPTLDTVCGRLKDFSTERLMRFITALDHDVIITIRDPQDHAHARVRVLVEV